LNSCTPVWYVTISDHDDVEYVESRRRRKTTTKRILVSVRYKEKRDGDIEIKIIDRKFLVSENMESYKEGLRSQKIE
jgi:hypothetical protein